MPIPPESGPAFACTWVSAADEGSMFDNFAHELSHQLGTADLYGSNCLSNQITLMSCTAGGSEPASLAAAMNPYHLDP